MKTEKEKINLEIESLTGDIYFYEMQIKFLTNLQETSPEVEVAFENTTFKDIINSDLIKKRELERRISSLTELLQEENSQELAS